MKNRAFSLYDIEEFIREAGAEKVNERAVVSLEQELEDTVKELVDEAKVYANYAGRKSIITDSDIELADGAKRSGRVPVARNLRTKRKVIRKENPFRAVINVTVQKQML
ncbi:MAG: hypothetical protein LVQ95_03135 [Candidatus Micrarchaeales archaeon]|nr:hypothetical protein [Candidatus Micrarchaeales archaeon]